MYMSTYFSACHIDKKKNLKALLRANVVSASQKQIPENPKESWKELRVQRISLIGEEKNQIQD